MSGKDASGEKEAQKGENPVEAANRLAKQAELQEANKDFKGAEESNKQASSYYLEALAMQKQRPQSKDDPESLKTLELLAQTHRRMAKMLAQRQKFDGKSQIDLVKEKLALLKKEKSAAAAKERRLAANSPSPAAQETPEQARRRQEREEKEQYLAKMREEMAIIQTKAVTSLKQEVEENRSDFENRLIKFLERFTEVHQVYQQHVNDQTKELLMSHGEKFIAVGSNPFALGAMKESASRKLIEQNNQTLENLLSALKKFTNQVKERMASITGKIDSLTHDDNSIHLSFGQIAALSMTPVGQAFGIGQKLLSQSGAKSELLLEEMQTQLMNQSMMESMAGGLNQSQDLMKKGGPNQRGPSEGGQVPQSVYIAEMKSRDAKIVELQAELKRFKDVMAEADRPVRANERKEAEKGHSQDQCGMYMRAKDILYENAQNKQKEAEAKLKAEEVKYQDLEKKFKEMQVDLAEYKRKYKKYYDYSYQHIHGVKVAAANDQEKAVITEAKRDSEAK